MALGRMADVRVPARRERTVKGHGIRRGRWVLVALGLVLLSACRIEIDVATRVEEDGSGEVMVSLLLNEAVRETLREKHMKSEDPTELAKLRQAGEDVWERGPNPIDLLEQDVPDGWEGERVTQGTLEGMRLRGEFGRLEEIPELLDSLSGFGNPLAERIGRSPEEVSVAALVRGFSITREGPVFSFQAQPDAREYEGATGGPNNLLAFLTLSVELPGGIREHDADEEKDGVLLWEVQPGSERTISATSDLTYDPSGVPWVPIGIGALAAGVVGVLGFRWVRGRGGDESEPPEPERVPERTPEPV